MTIAVIGAGAAGLMAAGAAAEAGAHVLLFDKNAKVGRKIMITGKGRCNVTNNCDVQTVLANVPVNPRFLYSALGGCSPADVMDFLKMRVYRSRPSAATAYSRCPTRRLISWTRCFSTSSDWA